MATDLALLQQAKSALLAVLADKPGKPSYNIDGQAISWGELFDRIEKLDRAIERANGPYEVNSELYS